MPEEHRMGPEQYLLLRGWESYVYEDIAKDRWRQIKEGEINGWLADTGQRFIYRPLGQFEHTLFEALGAQLIRESKAVGGFDEMVRLVEENRVEQPRRRFTDLN